MNFSKILGIVAVAIHGAEIVIGSGQGATKKQLATTIIEAALQVLGSEIGGPEFAKKPETAAALGPLIDAAVAFFNCTGAFKNL